MAPVEMSKPHLFDIVVFHPQPFYLPGSWIEGVVQLRTKESIKARAIRLKLDGEEAASWQEQYTTGSGDTKQTRAKHYWKKIQLIDAYITLSGFSKSTDDRTLTIAAGSYVFPFSVQIPTADHQPPSCEFRRPIAGTHNFEAHVRYRLTACIDIPLAKDIEKTHLLRVFPRISLNSNASLNVPVEQEELKKVGCWYCVAGTINVRARLLRQNLMPGETLQCTAEIVNNSSTEVVGVELSLVKNMAFHADNRVKHYTRTLASTDYPIQVSRGNTFSNLDCPSSGNKEAEGSVKEQTEAKQALLSQPFSLVVPSDLVPAFRGRAIVLSYELLFRVQLKGKCVSDVRLRFSPTFGTQRADASENTMSVPSILNPDGTTRTNVLLVPATTGEHPVYFGFDGLNYRPQEQFDTSKQVTYPSFYDTHWDSVPPSLSNFSPAVMQALADSGSAANGHSSSASAPTFSTSVPEAVASEDCAPAPPAETEKTADAATV